MDSNNHLQRPLFYLQGKGIGQAKLNLLNHHLGLRKIEDLLNFFPNRYIDRTQFYKINTLQKTSSEVQIIGKIIDFKTIKQKIGERLVATFQDETSQMQLIWLKNPRWFADKIKRNTPYVIFGKISFFQGVFSMFHPQMQLLSQYREGMQAAMESVYPSSQKLVKKGVTNGFIRGLIKQILQDYYQNIVETLSENILKKYGFCNKADALLNIHFPKTQRALLQAQQRLKFEELFFIQLQLLRKKIIQKEKIKGYVFSKVGAYFNHYYKEKLPFELTNAQKRVLKEIRKDLATGIHMNRLLQGDVGSGKTIIALFCMLLALDNGFQTALIAPTEILAQQHYEFVQKSLEGMGIEVALLTGSTKSKDRKAIYENIAKGALPILVGTHALLEDKVKFAGLGLVVIDEQHRFGVAQRSKMWFKNELPPHILVMTATPIPRTLAMGIYGDLDISIIDELPAGRKPIQTVHRTDKNRLSVFRFLKNEIDKGRQVYIVYPLIEESQAMDYKDLMDGYESVKRYFPMPQYQISIVHGQMKPEDKAYEMQRFVEKKTQIMVATTVIEVGVDVPNVSVMLIESAERFGLSQLHQLRGRVGRGTQQSYCILMSGVKLSVEAKTRLKTMVHTSDGFQIAEVDLRLRGPGNLMGKQQSGILNLKIADLAKDENLLLKARDAAIALLQRDPKLYLPENKPIAVAYQNIVKKQSIWVNIS